MSTSSNKSFGEAVHATPIYYSWWAGKQNILLSLRNKVLVELSTRGTVRHLSKWDLRQLYLNLSGCRGREQRSLHNQTAYVKCCTRITLDTLHYHFPPELTTLATLPLPTSHLFHEASLSEDALDELELQYWKLGPPFSQPEPVDCYERTDVHCVGCTSLPVSE